MLQVRTQDVPAQAYAQRCRREFIVVVQWRGATRKAHRSRIEATIRGLNLHGPGSCSYLPDTPEIRGMIRKVAHMVTVHDLEEDLQRLRPLKKSDGSGSNGIRGAAIGRTPRDRQQGGLRDRASISEGNVAEDTSRKRDVNSQAINIRLSANGSTPTAATLPSVRDLGEMRRKLAEVVRVRDHDRTLRLLIDGAAALDSALGSGIMATDVERAKAAMTGVQARALLREYIAQLFSPDAEIASCAARIVASRAPFMRSRLRYIPLRGKLTQAQSKAVAKAVANVLSAAGDRCYTRVEAVRLGPADNSGRCQLSGRILVTKLVQALPGGPRIALPDGGDKEKARHAEIVLEIAGAENPVLLDRSGEPADEAVLVRARFETSIGRDAIERGLRMLLIVPGIAAKRLSVEVEDYKPFSA